MSEKDESGKPVYETPVVVPLGEVAKGNGLCSPLGSGDIDTCVTGNVAAFSCVAGTGA